MTATMKSGLLSFWQCEFIISWQNRRLRQAAGLLPAADSEYVRICIAELRKLSTTGNV